jgi:hypothetical protein
MLNLLDDPGLPKLQYKMNMLAKHETESLLERDALDED